MPKPRHWTSCRSRGVLDRARTLLVTLEPCNHHGRTPPCTDAILAAPAVRRVIYGSRDPNRKIPGGGASRLREAGLEVEELIDPELLRRTTELNRPFFHWVRTGRPWVTIKTAHFPDGSMIPPQGQKTFTSPESLTLAHGLRKRADAILTGSGTILADDPLFTVRHVPDHPGKSRWLVVMDRRGRLPEAWQKEAEKRGFRPLIETDLERALDHLGSLGCLEVLVEAGPTLSLAFLSGERCLWNAHVVITRGNPDQVKTLFSGG